MTTFWWMRLKKDAGQLGSVGEHRARPFLTLDIFSSFFLALPVSGLKFIGTASMCVSVYVYISLCFSMCVSLFLWLFLSHSS